MKKLLAILFAISIFAFGCKKDTNDVDDEDAQNLFALVQVTGNTKLEFLEQAEANGGDPKLAIMQTLPWVQEQEGVINATERDSTYIDIEMSSGLTSTFFFNEVDEAGFSVNRGGGSSGGLKNLLAEGNCTNTIQNKKVLLYCPGWDQFYTVNEFNHIRNRFLNSPLIDNVDVHATGFHSLSKIDGFANYGLVIINTHGMPNGFMTSDYLSFPYPLVPEDFVEFRDAVLGQMGQEYFDKLITGELTITSSVTYNPFNINWWSGNYHNLSEGIFSIYVTTKYLETSPLLENTIVFGNFCYSGWTAPTTNYPNPIGKVFRDKNPVAYFAYAHIDAKSSPVSNGFAKLMEDSLTKSLLLEGDSTGNAGLSNAGAQFNDPKYPQLFFVQMLQETWCYKPCGEDLVDTRDGEVYATVCVGDKVWMAENLRYAGAGVCYDNDLNNCDTYGRLYTVDEAIGQNHSSTNPSGVQGICPNGWHLPSLAEWEDLAINFPDDLHLLDTIGWPSATNHTNVSGMSLRPGGQYTTGDNLSAFDDLGQLGYYWSTSINLDGWYEIAKVNDGVSGFDPDHAVAPTELTDTNRHFSCRCVKD